MIAQEVRLVLGGHETGLPSGIIFRLVLHSKGPDRHAAGFVGGNPLGHVPRPRIWRLGPQAGLQGVVHFRVVLHPSRRAPGRSQEPEAAAPGSQRVLGAPDEGDQRLRIALNRKVEMLQLPIVLPLVEGVAPFGEVAAVDVHAAQRIPQALRAEVAVDGLLLKLLAQLKKGGRTGLREGASEPLQGLAHILPGHVHDRADEVKVGHKQRVLLLLQGMAVLPNRLPELCSSAQPWLGFASGRWTMRKNGPRHRPRHRRPTGPLGGRILTVRFLLRLRLRSVTATGKAGAGVPRHGTPRRGHTCRCKSPGQAAGDNKGRELVAVGGRQEIPAGPSGGPRGRNVAVELVSSERAACVVRIDVDLVPHGAPSPAPIQGAGAPPPWRAYL
mmetsp:Transcript_22796/g.51094  ORF Transcript_22796/g.51094 Transcript_22796/m.51094 type:complete len:385 (+) Transcript_22796:793-1947(+)